MNPKEKSLTLFALIVIVLSVVLYLLSWIPLRPFLFAVFTNLLRKYNWLYRRLGHHKRKQQSVT